MGGSKDIIYNLELNTAGNEKLSEIRDILLLNLMSGKLDVSELEL